MKSHRISKSSNNTSPIEPILQERGSEYGPFFTQAALVQQMKDVIRGGRSWENFRASQKEAADMILHKLSRAANGNPDNVDTWQDIVGYAQLIVKELKGE